MFRNKKMTTMRAWISFIIINTFTIGDAKNTNKIVGGRRVGIQESPYHASVWSAGHHICGASIVATSHLLTSASCVLAETEPIVMLANLQVITGTSDRLFESFYHIHDVSLLIFHREYSLKTFWQNDIAILKLKSPIVESLLQSRVFLPANRFRPSSKVGIVGWNRILSIPLVPSVRYLHLVQMIVNSHYICQKIFNDLSASFHSCATTTNSNEAISYGDSGSGLVSFNKFRNRIIGIISMQLLIKKNTVFFTRVDYHIQWIQGHISSY